MSPLALKSGAGLLTMQARLTYGQRVNLEAKKAYRITVKIKLLNRWSQAKSVIVRVR